MKFTDKPRMIRKIKFEEQYHNAEFVFFGNNGTDCNPNGSEALINGTRSEISDKYFENGNSYSCYGLKATKLANYQKPSKTHTIASVKNFQFFVPSKFFSNLCVLASL